LAGTLGVSRNAVVEAYDTLIALGVLQTRPKSGTYVKDSAREVANEVPDDAGCCHQPELSAPARLLLSTATRRPIWPNVPLAKYNFGPVAPPMDGLSVERFRSCLNSVLVNDAERALGYDESEGYAPFRRWLASYMNARGVECSEENILVVAGYQQGIALIARALLNPAETALVEDPAYPDTRSALRLHGAKVQGIPIGQDGPDVGMLTEVVPSMRPKLFCVTPLWQNPTGIVMSRGSRKALLALSERYGFVIVEDGFTDEFCYSGRLIPPLSAEDRSCRVVYVGSMSKLLFGGLRLGYLESHILRIRKLLAARREAMVQAMEEFFPDEVTWHAPEGGLSTWVTLPRGIDSDQVATGCAMGGVIVAPGRPFSLYGRTMNNLRMSYSLCQEDAISEGIKIVGDVLKRITGPR
jgi:2-aminoadipate transaminase